MCSHLKCDFVGLISFIFFLVILPANQTLEGEGGGWERPCTIPLHGKQHGIYLGRRLRNESPVFTLLSGSARFAKFLQKGKRFCVQGTEVRDLIQWRHCCPAFSKPFLAICVRMDLPF